MDLKKFLHKNVLVVTSITTKLADFDLDNILIFSISKVFSLINVP